MLLCTEAHSSILKIHN